MPVSYQINPAGSIFRPKIETHINDNSFVSTTPSYGGGNVTSLLCVFASPKGRDNEIITIDNGFTGFNNEFGIGAFSLYGQPLLNAYTAARAASNAGARIHCLRVTPEDAGYSTATLIAKYKVDETAGMSVKYVVKGSDALVTNINDLDIACTVDATEDAEGYSAVKLFTIAYAGRGVYGANMRFRLTNDSATDKSNQYKNYFMSIYRNETILELLETLNVSVSEDAMIAGASLFIEDVVNDNSNYVQMKAFPESFTTLYNAYLTAVPDTNLNIDDFDPILGIDKYTKKAMPGFTLEPVADYTATVAAGETAVNVTDASGISLSGGSDGSIAATAANRDATLNALYKSAFEGRLDENIVSKNRYPSTLILDANFDINTKIAIAALTLKRTDCMAMLDFGTGINTRASVMDYYNTNFAGVISNRVITFEPYAMKVRDPYNQKAVTVTGTYWLASAYLNHIAASGGKHVPFAGNKFGIIEGYIPNSIYPVFDEDLHAEMMDDCADAKLNIVAYNPNQVVVRKMQNTSQDGLSSLTEQNNVLVLLDIKRDCEVLCSQIEYEFSDGEALAKFNMSLENITNRYRDAQVSSISARFEANAWEVERNIIHLYVEMVCRGLVKTSIIEIDVNPLV